MKQWIMHGMVLAVASGLLAGTVFAQGPANGVQATTVPLQLPGGLAYDTNGNLYIAATNDHVIRMVTPMGVISTVAGTGVQGFSGDGGAATSAQLDSPVGVALDSSNNLYIADTHNNRIREVLASTGVINTIAGTGAAGFSGDGGAALSATLSYPTAIAVDAAGSIYIADTNNNRIRKITGGNISTAAGNGEQLYSGDGGLATAAGLDSPNGVAVDSSLNIYIGDTHNQRVRLVTFSTGIITTFAGTGAKTYTADGGPSASAALARPRGIAIAPNGSILIADSDNDRVRSVTGGTISTVVGNGQQGFSGDTGPASSATIDTPRAVTATANSNTVVSDTENYRVRAVDNTGALVTIAGVAPAGTESLMLNGAATSVVYGTGLLTATYKFNSNTATGSISFYDAIGSAPVLVGSPVSIVSNIASLSTGTLNVGNHSIEAIYPGDANNGSAASGVFDLTVTPLAITATANPVNISYGVPIPTLTGTLAGVLSQDSGNVTLSLTTTATTTPPSAPGVYPISAALTGSAAGNYTVSLTAAANVTITQATTKTVLQTSTVAPYRAVPVVLTATMTDSSTGSTGTPTGSVSFFGGATLLGTSPVSGVGVATLTTAALPLGTTIVTAVYNGDTNFAGSTSSGVTETVTDADFNFVLVPSAGSPATQTIAPGGSAAYNFTVSPSLATFPLAVTFTVSGLPTGATYTLTPNSIPAGNGATPMTLVVKTINPYAQLMRTNDRWLGMAVPLLLLPFAGIKRTRDVLKRTARTPRLFALVLLLAGMVGSLAGCGGGGFFGTSPQTYNIVVTATSGSISHTQSVTLIVQ
ncbi:MAG: Ig-like domain repeat protein [Acidobacteriaceae bacterium]|nr:Ig-like domain repeat protein [Acidobacteriaceae bacterium]